jgi:hypothetical protein
MTTGTTTRIGLTTWSSGDDPFGRAQFQQDNLSLDNLVAIFRTGATGAKPVATEAAHAKTFFYDTTTGVLSYNNGTAWRTIDDKAESADAYTVIAGSIPTPQGASTRLSRADHKHAISTATGVTITGTSAEGTSTALARADHNHALDTAVVGAAQIASAVVGKAKLATDIVNATGALTFTNGDGLSVNTSATIIISANSLIVKTNSIDETHLKESVAGAGLAGGNGTVLSVNVDGSTLEINTDALRVKDAGIGRAKFNADVVKTNGGLSFAVTAGATGGLSVNTDGTTIELSTGSLRIKDTGVGKAKLNSDVVKANGGLTFLNADGLSVNTDGSTTELSSGNIIVKDGGVTKAKFNSDVVKSSGGLTLDTNGLSVNIDGTTTDLSSGNIIVKDAGITKAKFNSNVVKTNGGLVFAALDGLSVNTDASTIELSAGGAVRVKDTGIGKAKLNSDVVKSLGGLTFSNVDGLSVNTSTTIGLSSGNLIVNTNAIGPTHLTTSVAGNGITGGNGTALAALADPNGVTTGLASIAVGAGGIKVNGGIVLTSAGVPSTTPPNGNMNVDTTNHVLYYRSGSAWKNALWAAGTAGTSAPSAKGVWISNATTPISTDGAVGDIWITY